MEEAQIILERHEQRLNTLERDISDLKAVQSEIRTMNETLVTLATELKHMARRICLELLVSLFLCSTMLQVVLEKQNYLHMLT